MVDLVSVKVGSARNLRKPKEDYVAKLKYGNDVKHTRVSKKGSQWDETFSFKSVAKGDLVVEVVKSGALRKQIIGEVVVSVGDLKPGEVTATWYPIKKKKDSSPVDRGELHLSIEPQLSGGKSPRGKAGLSALKELPPVDLTPTVVQVPDPIKHAETLKENTARAIGSNTDAGELQFEGVVLEAGRLHFTFKVPDDSANGLSGAVLEAKLPRNIAPNNEYQQGPLTIVHLRHPKLQLKPCHRVTVTVKEAEGEQLLILIDGKAISLENRTVTPVKACFKVSATRINKLLENDDLAAFEKVPEYEPYELSRACFKGNVELVKACLERGDDVNQPDDDKETPLHKAVMNGNAEIIQLLADYGAEPRFLNKYEQTPVDIAEKYFKKDLIPIMRTYQ